MFAVFNAAAFGMAIFVVAAGLTLIFGLMRLLNMAQGGFFMIGAYTAYSVMGRDVQSLWMFLLAALVGGIVVALLGLLTDRLVLRRLRNVDPHYVLIATFALMMVCSGVTKLVWGVDFFSVNPPPGLDQPLNPFGMFFSAYQIFVIAAGVLVYIVLEVAIHRMWFGKLMQALAADPWMAGVLGLNVSFGIALSVMASFFLAGLAGGLLLPNQSLSTGLGDSYLMYAFFAVIIGGLGNIRGAFIGSLVLGLVQSLNTVLLPSVPGLAIYVVLAAFLLWKPSGLFPAVGAQAESGSEAHGSGALHRPRIPRGVWQVLGVATVGMLATLPLWVNAGPLYVVGTVLVQVIFALSWNILFGYTGLVSFGHAGFFAIGAYLAALALRHIAGVPFLGVLAAAALFGACAAWVVGVLALRRMSGVFLAVLTVALAEALRLIIGFSTFLGREDGITDIPRPVLDLGLLQIDLTSSSAYYWFLLVATVLITAFLWWLLHSRFGRTLQTVRQDAERAAFMGTHVARYRLAAFVISGAVAAVAGALYAPWSRIVTVEEVHWLASAQPMLNTLLGGVSSFWGPVVGAGLFAAITYATRTLVGLSELIVGTGLLAIILLAPNGAVGLWRNVEERLWGRRAAVPVGDAAGGPMARGARAPAVGKLETGGAR
ncbi:LIV-I protein H [Variovorax sp. WDL1]|nr:High-affinity branched-chain amino acid transport system permease protein LivH [Variovorax sp. B2]PNG48714.1 High-affinity branched-chain amino acid transport system permease protein LivH [Variovorax sp. B4]VTV14416.1 LIV-I protein H [Variovorax sp. WDL1]